VAARTRAAFGCLSAAALAIGGRASASEVDLPATMALVPVIVAPAGRSPPIRAVREPIEAVASDRIGLRIISDEELFASGSARDKLLECGADTRCLSGELRGSGARFGLIVVLNAIVDPTMLSMRVIDASADRIVLEDVAPLGGEGAKPEAAIALRASRVLDRLGYARSGRIVVRLEPSDARLILDGAAVEGQGRTFRVAPGSHELRAEQDGYVATSTRVSVSGGAESTVSLRLVSAPSSIVESPWLWIGVGTVVVATVVTVLILTLRPPSVCACVGRPGACPGC
jgi:PEGA domain-containing protein